MCVCVHQRARVYVVCMRVKTERGGGGETWAKFFLENHMNVCVFVFVHI